MGQIQQREAPVHHGRRLEAPMHHHGSRTNALWQHHTATSIAAPPGHGSTVVASGHGSTVPPRQQQHLQDMAATPHQHDSSAAVPWSTVVAYGPWQHRASAMAATPPGHGSNAPPPRQQRRRAMAAGRDRSGLRHTEGDGRRRRADEGLGLVAALLELGEVGRGSRRRSEVVAVCPSRARWHAPPSPPTHPLPEPLPPLPPGGTVDAREEAGTLANQRYGHGHGEAGPRSARSAGESRRRLPDKARRRAARASVAGGERWRRRTRMWCKEKESSEIRRRG